MNSIFQKRGAGSKARLLDWLLVGILGIIWGFSFLATKLALSGFGPFTVAAVRIGLSAFCLLIVAFSMGLRFQLKRSWPFLISVGIMSNAAPFVLLAWAQNSVPSTFAGVTMATMPIILLGLSVLFLQTRATLGQCVGIFIGLVGVVILIGAHNLSSALQSENLLPKIACLLAVICYAVGGIALRLAPPIHPIFLSGAGLLCGFLFIFPISIYLEGWPVVMPEFKAVAALIYLGLCATALATVLLIIVINSAGPVFLSTVNYQVPLWATFAGMVFLKETLPANFFLAFALILIGLFASQYFIKQRPAKN